MDDYRKIALWLEDELTPGTEQELSDWLARDTENQLKWEKWLTLNAAAKRLQVVPGDLQEEWPHLRDKLHLGRSTREKLKTTKRSRRRSPWYRRPIGIAFLSMIIYSLFLLFLHALRLEFGF